MRLSDRVKKLREKRKFTQEYVAKQTGITQQSYAKIEDGTTQRPRKLIELANVLGCDAGWLLNGEGDQKISEIREPDMAYVPGPEIKGVYPLISWVQAGNWSSIVELPPDEITYYPCPVACSDRTFVLRVKGISMETVFSDGELIFVDPEKDIDNGKFVVARLDDQDEATFKQIIIEDGKKFLKPANPDWPEQLIPINGNCTIVGVVVFAGRIF